MKSLFSFVTFLGTGLFIASFFYFAGLWHLPDTVLLPLQAVLLAVGGFVLVGAGTFATALVRRLEKLETKLNALKV
jgi:hypothetical protein